MKEKGESSFCKAGMCYEQIAEKYCKIRFAMRRYELGMNDNLTAGYETSIKGGDISLESIFIMLPHTTLYIDDFLARINLHLIQTGEVLLRYNSIIEYIKSKCKKINTAYGRKYSHSEI